MKQPATPLPWAVEPKFRVNAIRSMLLNHADPVVTEQNAAYIFHACNRYGQAITLLREVLESHDFQYEHGGQVYTEGEAIREFLGGE